MLDVCICVKMYCDSQLRIRGVWLQLVQKK